MQSCAVYTKCCGRGKTWSGNKPESAEKPPIIYSKFCGVSGRNYPSHWLFVVMLWITSPANSSFMPMNATRLMTFNLDVVSQYELEPSCNFTQKQAGLIPAVLIRVLPIYVLLYISSATFLQIWITVVIIIRRRLVND